MGFGCQDPALTYLNQFGYNVVRLPRTGIEPLLVLGRDRGLNVLGPLSVVWRAPGPPPTPSPPRPAADVEGKQSAKLNLSIGLKLLANALAAFGATTPSLEFAYARARTVQFTFTRVVSVGIDPFVVGEYLATGDLNLQNPFVTRYLEDDDNRAYVITEVLESDAIAVAATDSSDAAVTLDIAAISSVVGANVTVSTGAESSGTVTYKGPERVTFGFKAFEIVYANGRWSVQDVKPGGDIALFQPTDAGTAARGVLFNPGGLVRL